MNNTTQAPDDFMLTVLFQDDSETVKHYTDRQKAFDWYGRLRYHADIASLTLHKNGKIIQRYAKEV